MLYLFGKAVPSPVLLDPVGPTMILALDSLAAAGLAFRRIRRLAARLLMLGLAIVPTLIRFKGDLVIGIPVAAHAGMRLIALIGGDRLEILVATLLTPLLAALVFIKSEPAPASALSTASVMMLLVSTGLTLTWMRQNLLNALHALQAGRTHFRRLSHLDPLTGMGHRRQFNESL